MQKLNRLNRFSSINITDGCITLATASNAFTVFSVSLIHLPVNELDDIAKNFENDLRILIVKYQSASVSGDRCDLLKEIFF